MDASENAQILCMNTYQSAAVAGGATRTSFLVDGLRTSLKAVARLMQEDIRFPMRNGDSGGGASRVMAG